MNTDQTLDNIASKISRLQNLAGDEAATPGEAAAATEAIQRLLFEYNLDMADVSARVSADDPAAAPYESMVLDLTSTSRWEASLFNVVAGVYFCRVVTRSKYKRASKTVSLIGQPHNTRVVLDLHVYLVGQIRRLAKIAYNLHKASTPQRGWIPTRTFHTSFNQGAAFEVAQRLEAQHKTNIETHATGGALVIRKDREADEALLNFFPPGTTIAVSQRVSVNSRAYEAGKIAGACMDLTQPAALGKSQLALNR